MPTRLNGGAYHAQMHVTVTAADTFTLQFDCGVNLYQHCATMFQGSNLREEAGGVYVLVPNSQLGVTVEEQLSRKQLAAAAQSGVSTSRPSGTWQHR